MYFSFNIECSRSFMAYDFMFFFLFDMKVKVVCLRPFLCLVYCLSQQQNISSTMAPSPRHPAQRQWSGLCSETQCQFLKRRSELLCPLLCSVLIYTYSHLHTHKLSYSMWIFFFFVFSYMLHHDHNRVYEGNNTKRTWLIICMLFVHSFIHLFNCTVLHSTQRWTRAPCSCDAAMLTTVTPFHTSSYPYWNLTENLI